jgi:DNA-binding MarR family transcriptional regulator
VDIQLLTLHGRLLHSLDQDPTLRLRDLAEMNGVTERAVFASVERLVEAGLVTRQVVGRRRRYEIHVNEQARQALAVLSQLPEHLGDAARSSAR